MEKEIAQKLLESIESDNLVVLCGAGLSMASPSNLPSALEIAKHCANLYNLNYSNRLPKELESDIEKMAEYFWDKDSFVSIFLRRLLPLDKFRGVPNRGHMALVDFLYSKVLKFVVSTNVDTLVERAAEKMGEQTFYATVLESEIDTPWPYYNPYFKIHGCSDRDLDRTLWCHSQLAGDPTLKIRLKAFEDWISTNLKSKDIIIIGFWSDWIYLNEILERCVRDLQANWVVVIDLSDTETLKTKAPRLWDWVERGKIQFKHIQVSGADFLDDLRGEFCRNYIERIFKISLNKYEEAIGNKFKGEMQLAEELTVEDLSNLRSDFTGTPRNRVARSKIPDDTDEVAGFFHLSLLDNKAILKKSYYHFENYIIRLINAKGQFLSSIKSKYSAEVSIPGTIVTMVAVGAKMDAGLATNILRAEEENSIFNRKEKCEWILDTDLTKILEAV